MHVENRPSRLHGTGVFAIDPLEKDDAQFVYGRIVRHIPGGPTERYGFDWDEAGEFVYMPYAPWCYTNHSDDPNCEVGMTEDGKTLMIWVIKDILPGEELTIDYGYHPGDLP